MLAILQTGPKPRPSLQEIRLVQNDISEVMPDWRGYTFDKACSYRECRGRGRHCWEHIKHSPNQKADSSDKSISQFFLPCCDKCLEFSVRAVPGPAHITRSQKAKYDAINQHKTSRQVGRTSERDVQTTPRRPEVK